VVAMVDLPRDIRLLLLAVKITGQPSQNAFRNQLKAAVAKRQQNQHRQPRSELSRVSAGGANAVVAMVDLPRYIRLMLLAVYKHRQNHIAKPGTKPVSDFAFAGANPSLEFCFKW